MAQLRLQPPEPFDFKTQDDWPRWKRRFQQFRVASGLIADDAAKQISALLYCLGEEAEAVLDSTNITAEEKAVYNTVVSKFDDFFRVRRNVIFERARFNRRNQQEGESAEQYIMVLYELAANCEYGDMTSEMIRDRLVVGIMDDGLSKRLQLDPKLTLETAKTTVRQKEAVQEQQQALKGAQSSVSNLDTLRYDRRNSETGPRNTKAQTLQRLEHAPGAAKARTRSQSVPQEMLRAHAAKGKATTERCALPKHP